MPFPQQTQPYRLTVDRVHRLLALGELGHGNATPTAHHLTENRRPMRRMLPFQHPTFGSFLLQTLGHIAIEVYRCILEDGQVQGLPALTKVQRKCVHNYRVGASLSRTSQLNGLGNVCGCDCLHQEWALSLLLIPQVDSWNDSPRIWGNYKRHGHMDLQKSQDKWKWK